MIPIPEGAESYSEESTQSSGYGDSQETLDQPGMLAGSGGFPNNGLGLSLAQQDGEGPATKVQGLCELSGMPTTMTTTGGAGPQQQVEKGVKLSSELEGWHP